MANKMLIDATHPEETRVVVVRGSRVEEFDFESASRRQLRGNIYLAKVTRVEPSLQAAFIEYGGNRHGFLAFSEIHPDYYQIPVADRQALIAEEERAERDADAEVDRRAGGRRRSRGGRGRSAGRRDEVVRSDEHPGGEQAHEAHTHPADDTHGGEHAVDAATPGEPESGEHHHEPHEHGHDEPAYGVAAAEADAAGDVADDKSIAAAAETAVEPTESDVAPAPEHAADEAAHVHEAHENGNGAAEAAGEGAEHHEANGDGHGAEHENGDDEEEEIVESVGGDDAMEEVSDRTPRYRRQYKIQEVIKRRQIMLVQVVKEERGTKGAALTTYLSLAGRYSVLMPNTARGGGISRKITSADDRKRLKQIAQDLEVPEGMGVILRTAGANRTKTEVKRDFEYLMRLWETVRDVTLKSTAPKLVYEEGSLIKRSIRDLYNKDIDEVLVAGDDAYREAKDFMRMLMPSHAKNVKPYKDSQPVFTRYGVETQLDAMFSPTVQLKSGGYIVLNQTEALVSIDVNSGRATREHHIEDTATKTNCEASDEIARQLRLRDLAGLIVIDFIDMDENRNNRTVERRLKEALKNDRARIQVGRISHFGLMEMSRQRIRSSMLESSTEVCSVCGGTGHVRSVASVSLQIVRSLDEMLIKGATHNLIVRTRAEVALYVLNVKRALLRELEHRFGVAIMVNADATIAGQIPFVIDRGEQVQTLEAAKARIAQLHPESVPLVPEDEIEDIEETDEAEGAEEPTEEASEEVSEEHHAELTEHVEHADGENGAEGEGGVRRRRRRRRGRRGEPRGGNGYAREGAPEHAAPHENGGEAGADFEPAEGEAEPGHAAAVAGETREEGERRRRRRGRRGGRRNRRDGEAPFTGEPRGEHEPRADFEGHAPFAAEPARHDAATHAHDPDVPIPHSAEPDRTEPKHARHAQPEPIVPIPIPPVATPAPEPAASRRRSTVREPVPFVIGSGEAPVVPPTPAPIPHSEPVVISPAKDEQPKRGWWGKRLIGR
jgi:ribonuclease E